jgi:hypothetical protein
VRAEPVAVEPDVDLPLTTAEHEDLSNAAHALDLTAQDFVDVLRDLANRLCRADGDAQYRGGIGVEFLDTRLLDVARQQRQHAVHLVAHFLGRHVAVLVQQKPDKDDRDAFGLNRSKFVDAADVVDGLFDLVGHLCFDLLWRRSGWTVVTTTVGKSTFGKRSTPRRVKENAPTTVSDRMRTVAKTGRRTEIAASHCMGTPTQASDFRTDDEHRRGPVHSETATPSVSCATFFVATRSPAMTPLVISIRLPTGWPSVTIRSWVR